jgi:hypothetical protein
MRGFDNRDYYDAWKLRGDSPAFYETLTKDEDFEIHKMQVQSSNYHTLNPKIPDAVRTCAACWIYKNYLWNQSVRKKGKEVCRIEVSSAFIKAVSSIQRALAQRVAEKNISIECCPTSNLLISSFRYYNKHPILRMHSKALEVTPTFPQIAVSINTDDQGVFNTDLSNEYALMALALERTQNVDGSRKFSSSQIYEWIESVRELSVAQRFGPIRKKSISVDDCDVDSADWT